MRTATELFLDHFYEKNLAIDYDGMHLGVIDEELFIKALIEHDKEIKELIDEMIDKRHKEKMGYLSKTYTDEYTRALTELKTKIGV